ncbi:ankyrin repeat domain-containing protein [Psychroflexus sp. ALD_RP9]|uniref:ankyrin repeat domain-containing protein n=1 Tax=Psychroflexus sp. ALD_RP9 TaxID=2777186 RepID=UPI001A8F015A|nr:ankyrin repeat domain-containing protein [Psychroflexus sp. ALD_RP9]QSS96082.1 ankyrin repeat domain-containing protein [Psychroflexus sp. ALD_RP9]
MKIILLNLLLCLSFATQASNPLMQRDYWKSKPELKQLKADINRGHDATALNQHGFDALTWAILENANFEVLDYLIQLEGNTIDKLTHDGRTYLFWAVYKNNLKFSEQLIKMGAQVNLVDDTGHTPVTFAAVGGTINPSLYDLLKTSGADLKKPHRSGAQAHLLLMPSIKQIDDLNYFLDQGLSLEAKDHQGNTAIHYAAKKGNLSIIEYLVEKGLELKAINENNETALFFAARGARGHTNDLKFFKHLIDLGLDPLQRNSQGQTILHNLAARSNQAELITWLIEKGLEPQLKDQNMHTPLWYAAKHNSANVVTTLLEYNSNQKNYDDNFQPLLEVATRYNSAEIVKLLLDSESLESEKMGTNPRLGHQLFQSNKDLKAKYELLKSLIEYQSIDEDGNTLFHLAVEAKNPYLVNIAHQHGVPLNQKNKEGLTPLQLAVMTFKSTDPIKQLIQYGAKTDVKTDFGESLYDLAQQNEQLTNDSINFLKS